MRGAWLVLPFLLGCGCVPKSLDDEPRALVGQPRSSIGCRQDFNPRNPRPAACELPAAGVIATSCSINDSTSAPGYEPPVIDEGGIPKGGTPVPDYKIENLQCRFATSAHNEAVCTFDVENLETKASARGARVLFHHELVEDHGPTHHMRWLTWRAAGRCIPLVP